jgi:F-type H+-transporting ATPase subunit b
VKRLAWLLVLVVFNVPAIGRADEQAAEADAEAAEHGEHGEHEPLTLRSIFTGHEALQFWGAVVNFALLVYLIRRMAKKPLQNYLSQRRESIESGILEAAEVKRKAELAFNEYTERMKTLDRELAKLRQDIAQAAERDRERIVAEALVTIARLKLETEALVGRQSEQLEQQIRREVVEAAAAAAAKAVREASTPEDQTRLAEAFARELAHVTSSGVEKRA